MSELGQPMISRQWAMLRGIPRAPRKVAVAELAERLRSDGFDVSKRTLERDLHALSASFPLVLDDRTKPYGWSWSKEARTEFTPGLTTSQAVALLLAKEHLQVLLPHNLQNDLVDVFGAAERTLVSSGWKDWHRRTAVVPATLPLLPPKIDPGTMSQVQLGLERRRCLEARYRAKGETGAKAMTIHPLGLLSRGPAIYLVCTLFDYTDIRQLALHRMSEVEISPLRRREPAGFSLFDYSRGPASSYHSRGLVRLVAIFDGDAAEHLRETPLSSDQKWEQIHQSGQVKVSATVENDSRLRWWLLAFGSQVEVEAPATVRRWVKRELLAAAGRY